MPLYHVIRKDIYKTLVPVTAANAQEALRLVENGKVGDHNCKSLFDEDHLAHVDLASTAEVEEITKWGNKLP